MFGCKLGETMEKHRKIQFRHGCTLCMQKCHNIPQNYQKEGLHGCHDDIGNLWLEHVLDVLYNWFYLARMTKDAEAHIANCDQCTDVQRHPEKTPVENIQATHLLELVRLDDLII